MLVSLPVLDDTHVARVTVAEGESKERIVALTAFLSKSKYSTNKGTYLSRTKYFKKGLGQNSPHQLDAYLAYWLNYFMFPSLPEDGMHSFLFLVTVALA